MFRKAILAVCAVIMCVPAMAAAEQKEEVIPAAVWFADPAAESALNVQAKTSATEAAGLAPSAEEASAAAVSESSLAKDKDLKKQLKRWLSDGKQVYVYGEGLTASEVAEELGVDALAGADAEEAEKAKKKGGSQADRVHIVGIQETGAGILHVTSVKVEAAQDGKDVVPPASLIVQAVLDTEQARNEGKTPIEGMRCYECDPYPDPEEEDPIPSPSNITVLTGSDGTTRYVFDGNTYIAVASITSNWSLNRNYSHDVGTNFDLFYIRDNLTIDLHNGATGLNASTYHQLPYYSKDDIARWGPSNSSIVSVDGAWRHYPVNMPWDVSWNSSNVGDLSFYSEYRTNEAAYWNINAFNSRVTFSPGTGWLSYYTYAIIDLLHTVNVQYNGYSYSMTLNRTVTYDY